MGGLMPDKRRVKLIRLGGSQVILIPGELQLPSEWARISRDGDRIILDPVLDDDIARKLESMTPDSDGSVKLPE